MSYHETDDANAGGAEDGGGRPRSKVARAIAAYDLSEVGRELEDQWTGEGERRRSLRELATCFNRRLLETAMTRNGLRALDGEVENFHRLLTDGDVSSGARTQARGRLERAGIDVDRLEGDFVSHRAIHTYLTKYRGAEYNGEGTERTRLEKGVRSIRRLRSRLAIVSENTLARLRDADRVVLGEFDVLVDVRVTCHSCGTTRDVADLVADGGCDCG